MPVYTYRCDACGFTFDQRLGFNDAPPTRCPECGAEALYRVYKPVGIVFKGSGFYATDHRSPSGTKTSGNGKEPTAKTEQKAESSAEKSPAANKKGEAKATPKATTTA